jgi:hypothetical protein
MVCAEVMIGNDVARLNRGRLPTGARWREDVRGNVPNRVAVWLVSLVTPLCP